MKHVPHQAVKHSLFVVQSALLCAIGAAAAAASAAGPAAIRQSQNTMRTVWEGVYTSDQARRGEQAFKTECSYCHRDDLAGGFLDNGSGSAPALAGARAFGSSFSERWKDLSIGEMIATVAATMPLPNPASLTLQNYVDVVAYLLAKNGVPAGGSELPTDVEALGRILVTEKK